MQGELLSLGVSAVDFPNVGRSQEELEQAIEYCKEVKATSHEMAECARKLGYPESHTIIQSAKKDWADADAAQKEYQAQLDKLISLMAPPTTWTGSKLTYYGGVNWGPTGKETWYNQNLSNIIARMRRLGYTAEDYPYWIRDDGCKMLGNFIIAAANFDHYPIGSIVESSLGWCIVADTGGFANTSAGWTWLDIAVNW